MIGRILPCQNTARSAGSTDSGTDKLTQAEPAASLGALWCWALLFGFLYSAYILPLSFQTSAFGQLSVSFLWVGQREGSLGPGQAQRIGFVLTSPGSLRQKKQEAAESQVGKPEFRRHVAFAHTLELQAKFFAEFGRNLVVSSLLGSEWACRSHGQPRMVAHAQERLQRVRVCVWPHGLWQVGAQEYECGVWSWLVLLAGGMDSLMANVCRGYP